MFDRSDRFDNRLFVGRTGGAQPPPGPTPARLRTGRLRGAASLGGAVASPGGAAATALPGKAPPRNGPVRSHTGRVRMELGPPPVCPTKFRFRFDGFDILFDSIDIGPTGCGGPLWLQRRIDGTVRLFPS